jgi:pilus assembly protein Flp/PilA
MKGLTLKLQRFLASEDGPTAVDFAVLLSLIVIVWLTAVACLGTTASHGF